MIRYGLACRFIAFQVVPVGFIQFTDLFERMFNSFKSFRKADEIAYIPGEKALIAVSKMVLLSHEAQ